MLTHNKSRDMAENITYKILHTITSINCLHTCNTNVINIIFNILQYPKNSLALTFKCDYSAGIKNNSLSSQHISYVH